MFSHAISFANPDDQRFAPNEVPQAAGSRPMTD
jgi:hypothetical protein